MRKMMAGAALVLACGATYAQTTLNGLSFTVSADTDYFSGHGAYVTLASPTATAGMYGYASQWLVARSEFDLTGQQAAGSVFLSFKLAGTSRPPEQLGTSGFMPVRSYIGDDLAQGSDFAPTWTGDIGNADFGSLAAGSLLSFDVTSLFNAAIARGDAAFGVGIDSKVIPNSFAYYSDFALSVSAVPEPGTAALMLVGLGSVLALARRRRT